MGNRCRFLKFKLAYHLVSAKSVRINSTFLFVDKITEKLSIVTTDIVDVKTPLHISLCYPLFSEPRTR